MLTKRKDENFPFEKNDVVLAKYDHELFYAKIISISYKRKIARLLFDDESKEDVPFRDIFDVNETTSDIICVICKKDSTDTDNDIVLCDECNVGYHQTCHNPIISSDVLKPEIPWECSYCSQKIHNPHVESNPFEEESDVDEHMETDNAEATETQVCQDSFQRMRVDDGKSNDISSSISDEKVQKTQSGITIIETENNVSKTLESEDEVNAKDDDNNIYGEQVVIAHADSTSKEEDGENLIIDIESDEDCNPQAPMEKDDTDQLHEKTLQSNGLLKTYEQPQLKSDRYFKDLPKHNWLIEKLKMEKKLDHCEIDKMEKTIYTQQKSKTDEEDFLKRYLEEKSLKQKSTILPDTNASPKKEIVEKLTREERISKVFTCATDCNNNQIRVSHTHVSTTIQEKGIRSGLSSERQISSKNYRELSQKERRSPQLMLNFDKNTQKNTSHVVYRRQMSDITDLRPSPMMHIPTAAYSPTKERPTYFQDISFQQDISRIYQRQQTLDNQHKSRHCKTKIFRPEEIDRCLRNDPLEQDDSDQPFSFYPYRHIQNKCNSSQIRFTDRETKHMHLTVDRDIVSPHRYQPYTSTHNKRSRIYSDSTIQYLSPTSVHISHQTKRPSSEPGQIIEYDEQMHRPIISSRSSPGYTTPAFHQIKTLKTGQKQTFHKNIKTIGVGNHSCLNCGQAAQMLCSGCRKARYCSRECQLDNWRDHLYHCKLEKHA